MLDWLTVLLVIVAAYGYRILTDQAEENEPDLTSGSADHDGMPELKYLPAREISEMDASSYLAGASKVQQGSFAVPAK